MSAGVGWLCWHTVIQSLRLDVFATRMGCVRKAGPSALGTMCREDSLRVVHMVPHTVHDLIMWNYTEPCGGSGSFKQQIIRYRQE